MGTRTASLLAGLLLLILQLAAAAGTPAMNPDYVHALPDLRTARWLLTQQPGDPQVRTNEDQAIQDLDVAIRVAIRSGFDDHKDVNEHEQIEMAKDYAGRLHQALGLMRRAHAYLSKEVADPMGVSVRDQALDNIDRAGRAIDRALGAR